MARLGKVSHELNTGMDRIVEFLQSKGVQIENNPSAKITDEDYRLLQSEFGVDAEKNLAEKNLSIKAPKIKDIIEINNLINKPRVKQTTNYTTSQKQTESLNGNENLVFSQKNAIRDVWQMFIDIQEALIKKRCAPISIVREDTELLNNKLYVTINEVQNQEKIKSILEKDLGVADFDLSSPYIYIDETRWTSLNENPETIKEIRQRLNACYVDLNPIPAIDIEIPYAQGLDKNNLLTIDELKKCDELYKNNSIISANIPSTVAFISKLSVKYEDYLTYLFGNRWYTEEKIKKNDEVKTEYYIKYKNKYLSWEKYSEISNEIGLSACNYSLKIDINNQTAKQKIKDTFCLIDEKGQERDFYDETNDVFVYTRDFKPIQENFLDKVNRSITYIYESLENYCPKKDIKIDVEFCYKISITCLAKQYLREIAPIIRSHDNCSYNEFTGAIGIDFNWREQNIGDIIAEIGQEIPFATIKQYPDHKYKCKIETDFLGIAKIQSFLEENYEDIIIANDAEKHIMQIRLPYDDPSVYDRLCNQLRLDLREIERLGITPIFASKENGKVRLAIKYNMEARIEDIKDSITDMRKMEFGIPMGSVKTLRLGKLLKCDFPRLIFDVELEDDQIELLKEIIEEKKVEYIEPIMQGELEKISRLKNTFTMATTGQSLVNERLGRFIFDSSEAIPTQDISSFLKEDSPVYKDLQDNLLNKDINETQKEAIIKAMLAEDLAVIQGPPGTGKSTAIAELIWQLIRRSYSDGHKPERILLTSETNLAVDNAIARIINTKTNLVKPIRFGDEEKLESEGLQFSIELMKRWVEEGDDCLSENYDEDEETDRKIEQNLVLKNWAENIFRRASLGEDVEENQILTRWKNFLIRPNKDFRKLLKDIYISNANVIGATCSSIGDKKAEADKGYTSFLRNYSQIVGSKWEDTKIEFSTVIQDESSKATPAELILPFVYGKKAIVIGDHRQLPPMLDKEEFEDSLNFALENSLDEIEAEKIRLLKKYVKEHFDEMEISHFQKLFEHIDDSLKGAFRLQYRMHPDINRVIKQFYKKDGGLECGLVTPFDKGVNDPNMLNPASRYHGIEIEGLLTPETHVLFIESSSPEMKDGTSRVNYGEVEIVDKILTLFEYSESFEKYQNKFTKEEDKEIGVISFYGKQIKQLRSVAWSHSNIPIRVSTVDRFQGMERNIIIVSMVRSNTIQTSINQRPNWKKYPNYGYPKQKELGFAQSPNRLNVALSRAKRLLIIVGNRELFSTREIYSNLFKEIEQINPNNIIKQEEL